MRGPWKPCNTGLDLSISLPEMGGGYGHTTMWMYLLALSRTIKDGYNSKPYVMCILPQEK